MRLIVLSGHQRPISKVQMNRDDDLLFTASADGNVCVWDVETGERLGIYEGPKKGGIAGSAGRVSDIDIDFNSKLLLTGSGDEYIRLWNVKTGQIKWQSKIPTRVNSVNFSCGDKLILAANPLFLNQNPCVRLFNNPFSNNKDSLITEEKRDNEWISEIFIKKNEKDKNFGILKSRWSPLNDKIYNMCSDGTIRIIDVKKEKEIKTVVFDKNSSMALTDITYANDFCRAIVTSRNQMAKIYDITSNKWDVITSIKTDRGLNSCIMHPKLDCFAIGGGKESVQAALDKRNGNYEILFYSTIYELEMGRIETDCFSPINSMTFSNDGTQFILGYEEGQVRIFSMDVDFENKYKKNHDTFIKPKIDDDEQDVEDIINMTIDQDNDMDEW